MSFITVLLSGNEHGKRRCTLHQNYTVCTHRPTANTINLTTIINLHYTSYVKENAEALVVATKEIGLEVNADKTKYMVMSREQTTGLSHTMKVDNSSIERVEEFKYLGTTLTNQNSIQEEIKSRLKLGNACYHSVQNLLFSSLLSKNLKIKIYRTIVLPVVLY